MRSTVTLFALFLSCGELDDPAVSDAELAASSGTTIDFYNVLSQNGADPWVYKHSNGYYYFTKTTGSNVTLWRSRTLTGIAAGESRVIWTPPASGPGSKNIWAPELHRLDGKWYVYFAADDGRNANHRMYVLESESADPLDGPWIHRGQITDPTDLWAIDGTVFSAAGVRYFVWSGWDPALGPHQQLYLARMENPWTISSRVRIASPVHHWETNTDPQVNEGPQVILRNGVINLVYSASGSWTDTYCLGLITARAGSDLLDPASWTKHPSPIFQSANGLYGPGHHSFTKSPDGTEDWIVYHTARWPGAGWTRNIRAQRFTWNADHTPNLGAPVDPNRPIRLPSGEPSRARHQAEDGSFANGARIIAEPSASAGVKVGYIDALDSYVEVSVTVPADDEYSIAVRAGNGTASREWATDAFSVDGHHLTDVSFAYSGWNRWGVATIRARLSAGTHLLRFTKKHGYAELDSIDVSRAVVPGGPIRDGTYKLTAKSSGLVLSVRDCSRDPSADLILWSWVPRDCQKWRLEHQGGGWYRIRSQDSGLAYALEGEWRIERAGWSCRLKSASGGVFGISGDQDWYLTLAR